MPTIHYSLQRQLQTGRDPGAEIEHALAKLTIVDVARNLAFPIAILGAGISTLSGIGAVFPAVAMVAAGLTVFGRWYAQKKKLVLAAEIQSLEQILDRNTLAEMRKRFNRLTIEGPPV
jgi:hypothetical protein